MSAAPGRPYDVAIAGYGPVGAVLANLLGQRGMRVLVLEQAAALYDKPRAIGLDHESIRVLQAIDLADAFMTNTRIYPGGVYLGVDGEPIKRHDPYPPPYPLGWPPNVTFVQPELETLLRSGTRRYPKVDVKLCHRLIAFEEREQEVWLEADDLTAGARATWRARYLVACDGANSFVRNQLGIALEDQAFDEWWVVVDMLQRRPTALPPISTQYCWPSRPTTYVFGPGDLRRWELKLLPQETPEEFEDPARVLQAMAPYVDTSAFELWRSAVYRFHALIAERWRQGRVILAGDAAHQTPPFLGQGLNAGIRDAANLAWKLSLLHGAVATDKLLDTYVVERKPHVTRLIQLAKEFGLEIGVLDTEDAIRRDARLRKELAKSEGFNLRQKLIPPLLHGVLDPHDASGLAGHCCVQPKVLTEDGQERLLDDCIDGNFLLVTDGLEPQAWLHSAGCALWERLGGKRVALVTDSQPAGGGIIAVRETASLLRDWMRGARVLALIVRPDRYVHSAASTTDQLARQLQLLGSQLQLTMEEALQ